MKEFCLKAGLVLALIGAIATVVMRYQIISMFKEPVDIFMDGVESEEDIKGGLPIESDMYALLECFGSEEVTNKSRSGAVTSKNTYYYYILPIFVGEEDTYYVAMKIHEDNDDLYECEQIAYETVSYLLGEIDYMGSQSVHISGYLEKLDKEKFGYMKDWFRESGFFTSSSDINKYVLSYVFVFGERDRVRTMSLIVLGALVLGIVLIVVSVLMDSKYKARRKQLQSLQGRTVTINGVALDVSRMEDVDKLIWQGKTEKAKKKLMKAYRADPMQASQIVDSWIQITGLM